MRQNFFTAAVVFAIFAAAACSWTPHQRDPATIAAIQKTIEYRQQDHARWEALVGRLAASTSATVTAEILKDVEGLERAEKAEGARLESFKFAEEQKTP